MIKIEYTPGRARGEGKLSPAFVKRVADVVFSRLRLKEDVMVSVSLVDKKTIRKINRGFRGLDEVTDVLSFLYDGHDVLGEVLICPARAREQAKVGDRTVKTEMTELLVHGFLHLFGYDHIKAKDAKIMLPLQELILKSILCE